MALLLLLIAAPLELALGIWHFSGYWNGRYSR